MIVKWEEKATVEFAYSVADLIRQWKIPKSEQISKFEILKNDLYCLIGSKIKTSGFCLGDKKEYCSFITKQGLTILLGEDEMWVKPVTYKNRTWFIFFSIDEVMNTRNIRHVSDNQQLIELFGRH